MAFHLIATNEQHIVPESKDNLCNVILFYIFLPLVTVEAWSTRARQVPHFAYAAAAPTAKPAAANSKKASKADKAAVEAAAAADPEVALSPAEV